MAMQNELDQRRQRMLEHLSKSGALRGNAKEMARALGYRGAKNAVNPTRYQPDVKSGRAGFTQWVQSALQTVLGVRLKVDGNLGPVTRNVIKQFQRIEGLTAHGYLDERTIQVLELRTGVKAPRGASHEAIPHLLLLPRRNVWKPPPTDDKGKKKAQGQTPAQDAGAAKESDAASATHEDPAHESPGAAAGRKAAHESAAEGARPGMLQDEAMQAAGELAFADDFAQLAAERLGQDAWQPVQKQMKAWWKAQRSLEQRARWVDLAAAEARGLQGQAASRLRRRWWSQHVDGAS